MSLKSILSGLFGTGGSTAAAAKTFEATEYKGFRIVPAPYPAKGQFQTAGTIEKDDAAGAKQHRFVRAETHATLEDAVAFSIAKGKQIVDEQGSRLFD